MEDIAKIKLAAYASAFEELKVEIELFHVGENLSKLIQYKVITSRIQMQIVGEEDRIQRGSKFYKYLMEANDIAIYNNFIKFCDEIDTELALCIREELQYQLNRKGISLEECDIPPLVVPHEQVASADQAMNDKKKLQLRAYERTFKDLQLKLELFRVADHLRELREGNVIDTDILMILVGEQNPIRKGPIFFKYLLDENNINKYNNFITVCDEIEPSLAKCITSRLHFRLNHVGLADKQLYYSTAKQNLTNIAGASQPLPVAISQAQVSHGHRRTSQTDAPTNKGADIFLSYQWDIQAKVKHLYDLLIDRGYSCWMDKNCIGGGDNLPLELADGINECKIVLSHITTKYTKSKMCFKEVSLSDDRKKHIIPLLMEHMEWPPKGMDMFFTGKLYIDFKDNESLSPTQLWSGPKFDELIAQIDKFLG